MVFPYFNIAIIPFRHISVNGENEKIAAVHGQRPQGRKGPGATPALALFLPCRDYRTTISVPEFWNVTITPVPALLYENTGESSVL